jgi:hypothetical protein
MVTSNWFISFGEGFTNILVTYYLAITITIVIIIIIIKHSN